jgi:hypothetical protein
MDPLHPGQSDLLLRLICLSRRSGAGFVAGPSEQHLPHTMLQAGLALGSGLGGLVLGLLNARLTFWLLALGLLLSLSLIMWTELRHAQ